MTLEETRLLYLTNTYLFESKSKLISVGNDQKGDYIILDETIFYPQGGGQPSDTGTIQINEKCLNVHFVSFNNGLVHHYVKENLDNNNLNKGDLCDLKIDEERRLRNAKSHTSGHLLANVVELLAPELIGIKGYHFPEGPYVEFKGKLTSLTNAELIDKAVKMINEKIETKASVNAKEVDHEELKNLKNNEYQLQMGKKARLVQIDGFEAVPCGGTHLKSLSELNNFSIRKIQSPKDTTKISYQFS